MSLKRKRVYYLFFISFLLLSTSSLNLWASTNKYKDPEKKSEKAEEDENKENYGEIKNFKTYDPVTKKWSKIKEFDTVEILSEEQEEKEKELIYQDFWAYDPKSKKWYKVNIPNYGIEKPTWWQRILRNTALDISGGAEFGLRNLYAEGENIGFVSSDRTKDKVWVSNKDRKPTNLMLSFFAITRKDDANSKNTVREISRSDYKKYAVKYIRGFDQTLFIRPHLHYTFTRPRIRLGVGFGIAFGFISKVSIIYEKDEKKPNFALDRLKGIVDDGAYRNSPHMVLRPFATLGWILNNSLIHHFVIDVRPGFSLYVSQAEDWDGHIEALYGDIGLAYEKRLGSFMRSFIRIAPCVEYTPVKKFLIAKSMVYIDPANNKADSEGNLTTLMWGANVEVGLGTYLYKHKLAEKQLRRITANRIARRRAEAIKRRQARLAAAKKKRALERRKARLKRDKLQAQLDAQMAKLKAQMGEQNTGETKG